MKKAHIYNLKVLFSDGHKWDLDILAIDASWLFCWIGEGQRDKVENLTINLIKKDAELVKDNFGARSLKSNI